MIFETLIIWAMIFGLGLFGGYAIGYAKAVNEQIEMDKENKEQ